MTQQEFIQKTMIAIMGNPRVTNSSNFDDDVHHLDVYHAAVYLSNTRNKRNEPIMFFDDLNSEEAGNFPSAVSEREILHVIATSLQAIANKKSIKEQHEATDGNIEYNIPE